MIMNTGSRARAKTRKGQSYHALVFPPLLAAAVQREKKPTFHLLVVLARALSPISIRASPLAAPELPKLNAVDGDCTIRDVVQRCTPPPFFSERTYRVAWEIGVSSALSG